MRKPRSELNLTEWVVLAVAAEGPTHGWAVARLLGKGGPLGEAWSSSRPLVYRAIARLIADGLIRSTGPSEGRGPDRVTFAITPAGREAVDAWLAEPVSHVRDLRTEFLVKLLLLERRGADARPLVVRQRERLAPVAATLAEQAADADAPDRIVAVWRSTSAEAAMRFLDVLDHGTWVPAPGEDQEGR
jgi:DNA-binding PadR family transcriptional regulator